jgi:hypothetical protein
MGSGSAAVTRVLAAGRGLAGRPGYPFGLRHGGTGTRHRLTRVPFGPSSPSPDDEVALMSEPPLPDLGTDSSEQMRFG